jgi:hypothetical protein
MANDDPELQAFEALVGEWTMKATGADGTPWPGEARTRFAWMAGEKWLVQHWSVEMPEAPDGLAVWGRDPDSGELVQNYFDQRGVHRVYRTSLEDGVWRLWRDEPSFPQRFTGRISGDGRRIDGTYELGTGGEWRKDFDMTYFRLD